MIGRILQSDRMTISDLGGGEGGSLGAKVAEVPTRWKVTHARARLRPGRPNPVALQSTWLTVFVPGLSWTRARMDPAVCLAWRLLCTFRWLLIWHVD